MHNRTVTPRTPTRTYPINSPFSWTHIFIKDKEESKKEKDEKDNKLKKKRKGKKKRNRHHWSSGGHQIIGNGRWNFHGLD